MSSAAAGSLPSRRAIKLHPLSTRRLVSRCANVTPRFAAQHCHCLRGAFHNRGPHLLNLSAELIKDAQASALELRLPGVEVGAVHACGEALRNSVSGWSWVGFG